MSNYKRKLILESLDKNCKLDNCTLGMYDLTTYFSEDSLDSTLAEKILHTQNEQRPIKHIQTRNYYFMPEQQRALNFLIANDRVLFSAPTSFGKTMIIKEYIYVKKPASIVYIVPTNALAYELEKSFRENPSFDDYEIFDRSKKNKKPEKRNEKIVFIGTQEKFLEVQHILSNEISLFVIDEAYKLQESTKTQRGYKLSKSFLDFAVKYSNKIFLLSPNGNFIGFDEYEFIKLNSTFNAVDKNFHLVEEDNFFQKLCEKSAENKSILFCNSPNDIANSLQNIDKYFQRKNVDDQFISFLKKEFHEEWSVVKFLERGILTHHGLMPKFLQNKLILKFNTQDNYKLLIGTNSISEGINTPTKNIFIHPTFKVKDNNLLLLKNTVGRAGRLGQYPIGHIYSTKSIEEKINGEIDIVLNISDSEELLEIEQTKDQEKIDDLCTKYSITPEFYSNLISKYKMSALKIERILNVLKKDIENDYFTQLIDLAIEVFPEDYNCYDKVAENLYLQGVLQNFYKGKDGENIKLENYNDKINFFKEKCKRNYNDNKIMDGYMKMLYSTLEYNICPITNVGYDILAEFPSWKFGKNIPELIKKFSKRYYEKFYGISNVDGYSEDEIKVLETLKEYGIAVFPKIIGKEMLGEILSELKIRYSTYDVINAIKKLAKESPKNSSKFERILIDYL